jgi:hypothetical protein
MYYPSRIVFPAINHENSYHYPSNKLGSITQTRVLQFQQDGQKYQFQVITTRSLEIIRSQRMEKLLKKCHFGSIARLHTSQAVETPHILFILTSSLSSPNTNLFLTIPKDFLLPVAPMIIPLPLSMRVFLPMFIIIVTHLPKKMKLINCSRIASGECYLSQYKSLFFSYHYGTQ